MKPYQLIPWPGIEHTVTLFHLESSTEPNMFYLVTANAMYHFNPRRKWTVLKFIFVLFPFLV